MDNTLIAAQVKNGIMEFLVCIELWLMTHARRMSVDKIKNKAAHSLQLWNDEGICGDAVDMMTMRR